MLSRVVACQRGLLREQGAWLRPLSSQASGSSDEIADVAIVGGGMVGAALAALLASNPLTATMRVVLLDQKVQATNWSPQEYPELRVSTITPASIRCLQKAGAWDAIQPHVAPFTSMQVWEATGGGCIRWHAHEAGLQNMGVVAENSVLQASLLAAASWSRSSSPSPSTSSPSAASPTVPSGPLSSAPNASGGPKGAGTEFWWPATIKSVHLPGAAAAAASSSSAAAGAGRSSSGEGAGPGPSSTAASGLACLELQDGRRLHARLLVAADGSASKVRDAAGLRTFGWSYQQRGLVATVRVAGSMQGTAWQRFLPTGPLALLPVRGDGLANIVWSGPPQLAQALERMGPQEFADAVNKALQSPPASATATAASGLPGSLGSVVSGLVSPVAQALGGLARQEDRYQAPPLVEAWVGTAPKSFPLQLKQAGRYVLPRLALMGDAAHAVHPLAGQGVNLGFGDAEALAAALALARECGADPGDVTLLQDHYERPRQRAVLSMTAAMDGLWRVFGLQAGPVASVRNLGLDLLNAVPPVKNNIMKFAMGL